MNADDIRHAAEAVHQIGVFGRACRRPAEPVGDISADGTLIVLRREDLAQTWERFNGEAIGTALARAGQGIPVIGPPIEPNGEWIALLPNGKGYVTATSPSVKELTPSSISSRRGALPRRDSRGSSRIRQWPPAIR